MFTVLDVEHDVDSFVNETIRIAMSDVSRAVQATIDRLFDKSRHKSPSDLLQIFKFPSSEAFDIALAAEVFELTIEMIHERVQEGKSVNLTDVGRYICVRACECVSGYVFICRFNRHKGCQHCQFYRCRSVGIYKCMSGCGPVYATLTGW